MSIAPHIENPGPGVGPVAEARRIIALDVVRGAALLGILLINITDFGYPYDFAEYADPNARPVADYWTWIVTYTFVEGTQRAIFALLFGAGIILLTSRIEASDRAHASGDIYYRRTIWLIVFGVLHAYFLLRGGGDVLYRFGIAALFLYPLRHLAPKVILVVAVSALTIRLIQFGLLTWETQELVANYKTAQDVLSQGGELSADLNQAVTDWEEQNPEFIPTESDYQERIEQNLGGYWDRFRANVPATVSAQSENLYRWDLWGVVTFMTLGMALMKWGVLTLQRPARVYWLMVLGGYGVGIPVSAWETQALVAYGFGMIAWSKIWPSYDIGRLLVAMGHLGALLLFCRSGWLGGLQRRLAAVGRMALTNYVLQTVLGAILFWGIGLGLYGAFARHELYYVVLAIWLVQLYASPLWLKYFRFGPLEWVWRSLTYWKIQPMVR